MTSILGDLVKSTLSRVVGGLSGLPYQLDSQPLPVTGASLDFWSAIYQGSKKEDPSQLVTVFVLHNSAQSFLLPCVQNAGKKLKTLRHPNLIKFIDYLEDTPGGSIYLVTERVQPLIQVLATLEQHSLPWGFHCLAKALQFLHQPSLAMIHGNLTAQSVFVCASGEWKLGGMHLVTQHQDPAGLLLTFGSRVPSLSAVLPPELQAHRDGGSGWTQLRNLPVHALDAWLYGTLLRQVYGSDAKVPSNLQHCYRQLLHNDPSKRLSMDRLLSDASTPGMFFDHQLMHAAQFLENISIAEPSAKIQFFKNLPNIMDQLPGPFCKYKLLPVLMNAIEFGSAGPRILPVILQLGDAHLSKKEYQDSILSLVVRLFGSSDRGIRLQLLESLAALTEKMNAALVNDQLYPHVVNGFQDPDPFVREATVKAAVVLAPLLASRLLNDDLLRQLAKVQVDPEPGIRTNTIICLGKISKHLSEATRRKVLMTAFAKSLRDPFPPARASTLLALQATVDSYDPQEMAIKMIPTISGLLVDPDKTVRANALKTVQLFLATVEAYAASIPDPQATSATTTVSPRAATVANASASTTTNGTSSVSPSSSWGEWAMGALAKTVVSATESGPEVPPPSNKQETISAVRTSTSQAPPPSLFPETFPVAAYTSAPSKGMSLSASGGGVGSGLGGWDGGWDDMVEQVISTTATPAPPPPVSFSLGNNSTVNPFANVGDGWDFSPVVSPEPVLSTTHSTVPTRPASNNNAATSPLTADPQLQRKKEERRARMEQMKAQQRMRASE